MGNSLRLKWVTCKCHDKETSIEITLCRLISSAENLCKHWTQIMPDWIQTVGIPEICFRNSKLKLKSADDNEAKSNTQHAIKIDGLFAASQNF